jgi:hypothetical protein
MLSAPPRTHALASRSPVSEWLNPRRRMNAETVLEYIRWHGRKVLFKDDAYSDLRQDSRLDPYAVDTALDDLFRLGCVHISMVGTVQSVSVLSEDIDRWAGQAKNGKLVH